MLWAERRLGLRRHDGPPGAVEVIIPLVMWSSLFEFVLPRTELFRRSCDGDHRGVPAYSAGALGVGFCRLWCGEGCASCVD